MSALSDSPSLTEQGFVLGAALLGLGAEEAGQHLAGSSWGSCRGALGTLAALRRPERAAALARMARQLLPPVPRGLELVHPSWIDPLLAPEPTPLLLALLEGLPEVVRAPAEGIIRARGEQAMRAAPLDGDERRELHKALFVGLRSLPDPNDGAAGALAALPVDALARACAQAGAARMAVSLAGAPASLVAHATIEGLRAWANDFGFDIARALAQRLPRAFAAAAWPDEAKELAWVV